MDEYGRMHMKWKNRTKGFSLVEVLLVMAVLSIGILGVASLQMNATSMNTRAAKSTNLNTIAMDRLEKLMQESYESSWLANTGQGDSPLHTPGANSDLIDNDLDGLFDEGDEKGQDNTPQVYLGWAVSEDHELENTKTIVVTVSQGKGAGRKQVSFRYYKSLYY